METSLALIIDDDQDTADLFRTILGLVGFECEAVYTAKGALVYLASKDPDLVLLDMRLGLELDGSDILYQIRSNPRFDKTRVIVITAYPGMLAKVENLADLILLKPIEIEGLKTFASRLTQLRPKSYVFRDPVSNLYSQNFFMTRLEHAFERKKRFPGFLFATMVIQFIVNLPGDAQLLEEERERLLKRMAEILTKKFRPTDTFGYLGGQQVVALYEDLKKPDDTFIIIHRLREDLSVEIDMMGGPRRVTPVIGAVLNYPRFKNPDEILKAAIEALDRALQLKGEYFVVAE